MCREALRRAQVVEVLHTGVHEALLADVPAGVRVTHVGERVMARLSDAATPPCVVAVVRTVDTSVAVPPRGALLVLEHVADPGNVGTLVRTATAFGAAVVLVGGADPFGPKAVRSSAGACYAAAIHRIEDASDLPASLRGEGRTVLGLAADGPTTLAEAAAEVTEVGAVLVLGSEPHGLGASTRTAVDRLVRIPMSPDVESLNVAAAGAIAMHTLMGA